MVRLRHSLLECCLFIAKRFFLSLTDALILLRLSNRSNALFVVLVETGLGGTCDTDGKQLVVEDALTALLTKQGDNTRPHFYQNNFDNDYKNPLFYQGIEARIKHT
jgi:hypothetical protein